MDYQTGISVTYGREDYDKPIVRITALVLLVIGILSFVVLGIVTVNRAKKYPAKTEAVITGFSSSGTPCVEYRVDGKTYDATLTVSSSSDRKGDKMTVFYDPEDPSRMISKSGNSVIFLSLGLLGAVFSGTGLYLYLTGNKVKKEKERRS